MSSAARWRVRLTPAGGVALVAISGALGGALIAHNGALALLGFLGGAVFVTGLLVGALNLRNLRVWRMPPAELFAGLPACGCWWVENRRRRGAAIALVLEESASGVSLARFETVHAGRTEERLCDWLLATRGTWELGGIRVGSPWPFGLTVWSIDIAHPVEVLVFPTPVLGPDSATEEGALGPAADEAESWRLRGYIPGDRAGSIHWKTTARLGQVVVSEAAAPPAERVIVRLNREVEDWEREIRRGCGAVVCGFARGAEVGLDATGEQLEPRGGGAWRQHLLATLAVQPFERGEPS
jgi:uncharacterized protein (DUF58 family)